MSRQGSFAWIAAFLLAAAIVSLAVVLRDAVPPSAAGRAPVCETDVTLESRLETLSLGVAAARGGDAAGRASTLTIASLLAAFFGGFGIGAATTAVLARRRRPVIDPVVARSASTAGEPAAEAAAPSEAEASDEAEEPAIACFEPNAVDLKHRGGLLPWSREPRHAAAADPAVEERLRTLERTLLRLEQKLDELADPSPVEAGGEGTARLAGFAHALTEADHAPAAVSAAWASASERASARSPDASRVLRAVRLLSDDGWTEERIADRLRLEPEDVLSALPGSRRRKVS